MVCFFKRLDTFVTFGQADVTEFSVPLASSGGNTGSVTVVGELTQAYTRQWLIMQGRIWYTTEVNPDNGLTKITVADPLAAFSRTLVYSTPSTNILGEYIKAVAEAEYINLADTAYDMPYLTVTNSDTTTFTPVAPEDGLFSLENLMRDAQARGLFLTFDFDANGLSLSITPGDTTEYPVVVGDGHTQLISETYAQTAIAKVTVISDLGYPHDYYLSIDGTISTTPPVNRASGEWVTVKQGEDNLLDTATAVFAENIQSHKIEFYSDIQLDLYAHVNVRLNGKVYASQITYVGIMSRDNRYLYRCGELATTLTEKVASASSKYITAEQAKGLAPVQSVNGQTGAVVLDASDVGALPDTYVAPVQSVNGQAGAVNTRAYDFSFVGTSDFAAQVDTALATHGAGSYTFVIPSGSNNGMPTNTYYYGIIQCTSTNYVQVICWGNTGSLNTYRRLKNNGTWLAWHRAVESISGEEGVLYGHVYRGSSTTLGLTDFNAITTDGLYYIDTAGMANAPDNYRWSHLYVTRGTANYITQMLVKPVSSYVIAARHYSGSPETWEAWRYIHPTPTVTSGSNGSLSVASGTWTTLRSLTLTAGTYLIEAGAGFPSNTTGYRTLCISTGADSSNAPYPANLRVAPASGTSTILSVHYVFQPTATTTYNINAYQNSGSALTVSFNTRYTKLA